MQRYLVQFLIAALVLVARPGTAWADVDDPSQATVHVGPINSGPVTAQGTAGFNPAGTGAAAESRQNPPSAPSAGAVGSSDVTFRQIPNNAIAAPAFVDQNGVIHPGSPIPIGACPPGQTGFFAFDGNGAIVGTVCVANGTTPPGIPTPLDLAREASAAQPWPVLRFGINPGIGLTGLASWFWLTGNPQMSDATASAGPLTVRVHATLSEVVWNFGDGARVSSGTTVGRAFPAPGGIPHVYQTDSLGQPGGYGISALLRYEVSYSVNGGPFVLLGFKARPFVTTYLVNQLQPQAVGAP